MTARSWKEALEAARDKGASAHWVKIGAGKDCASADYKAGQNALIPLITEMAEALKHYASYMDGDNPEFIKSGWQKYPSPKNAKEALSRLEAYLEERG